MNIVMTRIIKKYWEFSLRNIQTWTNEIEMKVYMKLIWTKRIANKQGKMVSMMPAMTPVGLMKFKEYWT